MYWLVTFDRLYVSPTGRHWQLMHSVTVRQTVYARSYDI